MSSPLGRKMAAIASAIARGDYRYTLHGAQQRIARHISGSEVEQAVASGVIIEDYPEHHYGPAALILGWTAQDRPLHVLCSVRPVVDIVTVYEPDPAEWLADLRTRRSP